MEGSEAKVLGIVIKRWRRHFLVPQITLYRQKINEQETYWSKVSERLEQQYNCHTQFFLAQWPLIPYFFFLHFLRVHQLYLVPSCMMYREEYGFWIQSSAQIRPIFCKNKKWMCKHLAYFLVSDINICVQIHVYDIFFSLFYSLPSFTKRDSK